MEVMAGIDSLHFHREGPIHTLLCERGQVASLALIGFRNEV